MTEFYDRLAVDGQRRGAGRSLPAPRSHSVNNPYVLSCSELRAKCGKCPAAIASVTGRDVLL
jgi:hypothetical protein